MSGLAFENLRQLLFSKNINKVKQFAKSLNIKGYSNKSKGQVIEMIIKELVVRKTNI